MDSSGSGGSGMGPAPRHLATACFGRQCDGTPQKRPRFFQNALTERSEEHTSELQSLRQLVCRLLFEKKKKKKKKKKKRKKRKREKGESKTRRRTQGESKRK